MRAGQRHSFSAISDLEAALRILRTAGWTIHGACGCGYLCTLRRPSGPTLVRTLVIREVS